MIGLEIRWTAGHGAGLDYYARRKTRKGSHLEMGVNHRRVKVVWATILGTMIVVWPYSKWVAVVQVPYLVWVSIATVLQLSITWVNWKP